MDSKHLAKHQTKLNNNAIDRNLRQGTQCKVALVARQWQLVLISRLVFEPSLPRQEARTSTTRPSGRSCQVHIIIIILFALKQLQAHEVKITSSYSPMLFCFAFVYHTNMDCLSTIPTPSLILIIITQQCTTNQVDK